MSEPIQVGGYFRCCKRCGAEYLAGVVHECPSDPTPAGTGPGEPSEAERRWAAVFVETLYQWASHRYREEHVGLADMTFGSLTCSLERLAAFVRAAPEAADARPEAGEPSTEDVARLRTVARQHLSGGRCCVDDHPKWLDGLIRAVLAARAATPPGAASGTREALLEEAARIAEEFDAFTGASYCDELAPTYQRELAHEYGRGGCQVRRMIAEEIRRRAAVPPPSGEPGEGLLPTDEGMARAEAAARRLFAAQFPAGGTNGE